tara:strand:+ start:99 stop:452 length:354 start_codon:yes stop_codon:yes gene_type:complete
MERIWAMLGLLSMALAIIGVVLPLLPTVPFLLLAAFCFARSSQKLHSWLISHKTFGPMIVAWTTSGAIGLTAKRYATLSILAVFSLSLFIGLDFGLLILQGLVLSCVLGFIWTRPHH